MTQHARRVLEDCRIILEMMEHAADAMRMRVLWIGGLSLLRMVGHVLKKVDAQDPEIGTKLNRIWPTRRQESIFAQFIEQSRIEALKEYEVDLYDLSDVLIIVPDETGREVPHLLNKCMFMPLMDGFMAGEDGREVFRKSIAWWSGVLTEMETS